MGSAAGTWTTREALRADSAELADLLNAIIAKGGTTAHEEPFTPEELEQAYLIGPEVQCCFVAVDPATGRLEGFQSLCRHPALPPAIGDVATFARADGARRGVGAALLGATRARARALGLSGINACIRADNAGGLAFYGKQGFVDHAVMEGVPLRDGTPVDRIVKRLALA